MEDLGYEDGGGNASRFFKSIIYQAKSSKSERNKGLDSIVLVDILRVWSENNITKEEKLIRLMVTGISPQKVIGESGVQLKNANEWNTCLFGKHLTEKYQEDIKSIIKTETNSITTSQTLNWLIHLLTNEYTVDVKSEMENGGSLVENVGNSNTLIFTINEAMALVLGVENVTSSTQLKINVKEGSNIHSTVKPIALMEYLIKMVTPKGGIVLDPFAGSGTTGVACKNLNRNYILIEKEQEYIEIIKKRLITNQDK
ncbi:site-specific DNA-methyltransferase [Candidatus Woesebacteria bacterium]|nr:site-specific DNA-methyltransferase [Candidatus Woesebacteria bacterium]